MKLIVNCRFCDDKTTRSYWLSVDEWRNVPCVVCNAHRHKWGVDESDGDWVFCSGCDLVWNTENNKVQIGG